MSPKFEQDLEKVAELDSAPFVDGAVVAVGKDPIAAVGPGPGGGSHVTPGVLAALATA
ncbi:MAG TPA: hypothetical protein VF587_16730 [Solirubrobacteraceae bacterium]|jgi:hypothetical protein